MKRKTPYEALTGEKPKVGSLRVFGCAEYSPNPKDEEESWTLNLVSVFF